jgi:tetratricopeptide (TPR) repeat protein
VTDDVPGAAGLEGLRTEQDLLEELNRLRISAARRRGKVRLSLQDLQAATGVPKSSLANYLAGRTLMPVDVLDRMVLALGVAPLTARMWAAAWERVTAGRLPAQLRPPVSIDHAPAGGGLIPNELQPAHLSLLRQDDATWQPALVDGATQLVPAQLPADVAGFTGRQEELSELDNFAADNRPPATASPAVVISAVSGTAGVGKTALAIRWAHRVAAEFPDGQLYINLRGYDLDQPMTATDVLARFLTTLGVASQDIPLDVDERAARYRTKTAGRRILIVLDNAATVEQVRPLLPGTPSCAVLVTSRDSLAGLVALHGAHRLDLDLLPVADAVALLRRLIGPRVDTEPDAAAALAGQCARLPLALRVAAELAVTRPTTSMAGLVAELADQRRRLDLLDAGGDLRAAVRAVFSWSVRHLPPDVTRTFGLLGLHPGPDLDAYAAAALANTSLDHARRILDQLGRAHLIHPSGAGRYAMHDLLRAYATSLATTKDAADDPSAALGRLFDYYLGAVAAAMNTLHPAEAHRRPSIPSPATPTPAMAGPDAARDWLDTERPTLVAVAAHTSACGWPTHAVRLSSTVFRYLAGGHYTDALAIFTYAQQAAGQIGDRAGQAQALADLGGVHLRLGRSRAAAEHLQQAVVMFRQAGDRTGEARALGNLGTVEQRRGCFGPAADHHEQALALYLQTGDRTGEARALVNLGNIEQQSGRYGPAADLHQWALDVFRQIGDRSGEASALDNLGTVEAWQGRYGPAADYHQQALAIFRQIGDRSGEATALDNLGTVHTRLGRPEQAAEHHLQALTLFRQSANQDGETGALNGLGEAAHTVGHTADALTHHTTALTIATDTGARDQQARAHTGLGRAHHTLDDPTRARYHYEQALALYTNLGSPDAGQVRAHLTALAQPPRTPATTDGASDDHPDDR